MSEAARTKTLEPSLANVGYSLLTAKGGQSEFGRGRKSGCRTSDELKLTFVISGHPAVSTVCTYP